MEQEPSGFYEAVRQGYLELAAKHPERFVILRADGTEEAVAASIENIIKERFHGLF